MGSEFLAAAMYMDAATMNHYFTGGAAGIDIQGWPGNVVPFAPSSEGESIALKKFARAHRARYATGPPKLLMVIKIPARFAVEHLVAKEIKVLDDRPEETIGFARPVNSRNFPSMQVDLVRIDDPEVSAELLRSGLALLR